MIQRRLLICWALSGLVVWGLALAGVTQALGAHPFWDVRVVGWGALPALLASLVLARHGLIGAGIAALIGLAAYGAAVWGKTEFAASFAENTLAGQVWYFGWITTSGAAIAALALLALTVFRR